MKKIIPTNVFVGLALLLLGIGFLLNNVGNFNFNDFFGRYWPVLVLLFAFFKLLETRWNSAIIWGLIGGLLLINTATSIHINFWGTVWPLFLIWIGTSILLRGNFKHSLEKDEDNHLSALSIFGSANKKSTSNNFKSANITTIFGGSKIDLRNAKISENGADIDVFVAFGGAEIFLPKNLPVKLDAFALFGGSEDKRGEVKAEGKPKVTIRGAVLFGGIEIKE